MLVFIDESGDLGLKLKYGSSKIFVLAMITFKKEEEATKASLCIDSLRSELRKNSSYEFKFNKMKKEERLYFLESVETFDFKISAIVIKKTECNKLTSIKYVDVLEKLLAQYKGSVKQYKIRIDKVGDRNTKNTMNVFLRNLFSKKGYQISSFKFLDSKSDNLIQLVDVVAGSIHRFYESEKKDSGVYLEILNNKIKKISIPK